MKHLTNIDLTLNQLMNALAHMLATDPVSPVEGQVWYNSTTHLFKVRGNGATLVLGTLSDILPPAADLNLNSKKIVSLAAPTDASDAATKGYVDGKLLGLSWKTAVRVASSVDVTVAGPGATIDGVTMAQGDRVLLYGQATGAQNGIYVFDTAGTAMTRAADANTAAGMLQATVYVEEGTHADTGWVCTTNAPITLDTTALAFAQMGSGTTSFGTPNLTLSTSNSAGVATTAMRTDATVAVFDATAPSTQAFGDAASAGVAPVASRRDHKHAMPANPMNGLVGKYAANVGDNSSTSITVTHNLGTKDVTVTVYRVASPYDVVLCDVTITDTNNVALAFAVAPTTGQYRVVVVG